MNRYEELKNRFQQEINAFPMKWAFSKEQFDRSMQELGLDPADTDKIIGIPGERVASREEYLTDLAVLPSGAALVLQAGKRTLTLKADDLEHYKGERGRRGNKLPRGFQRVDQLLVEVPSA